MVDVLVLALILCSWRNRFIRSLKDSIQVSLGRVQSSIRVSACICTLYARKRIEWIKRDSPKYYLRLEKISTP
ncbi:hypothetical protein BDW59DRAFT_30849 [Aspergillus cavernicola]|uniref:Secreted protein n=1 Tax=Aspergillus cavernicola TaxID=176166 RepID=A0ABR4HDD6_9EURO